MRKCKVETQGLWCNVSSERKKKKNHETEQTVFRSSFFYCKSARANRQSMQIILVFKQSKHSMQQQQNRKKKRSERKKFCRRQYTTGKCDEWAHVNEWNLYTAMWYACSSTFRFLLFFFRDACSRRHRLLLFFLYRVRVCYFSSTVEAATTTAVFDSKARLAGNYNNRANQGSSVKSLGH